MLYKLATLRSAQNQETEELLAEENIKAEVKVAKKKDKNLVVSLCMPKVKLNLLEAQDFEKEIVRGIRERIGTSFIRGMDS